MRLYRDNENGTFAIMEINFHSLRVAQTTGLGAVGTRSVSREFESRPPLEFNNSLNSNEKQTPHSGFCSFRHASCACGTQTSRLGHPNF